MRERKSDEDRKSSQTKPKSLEAASNELPIIASARTGLSSKDESIDRRVPVEYVDNNIRQVIEYLTTQEISDSEHPLMEGIKKELSAKGSVVVINGKTVTNLDDPLSKYLDVKEHQLPNGATKRYRALDIEISAVQQGGLYKLLR